jgi:hypothetical protein
MKQQREIRLRVVLRDPPDYKKLARVYLQIAAEMVAEQQSKEAAAQRRQSRKKIT